MDLEEKPHLSLSSLFLRVFLCHLAFIFFLSFKKSEAPINLVKREFLATTVELKSPPKTPPQSPKPKKPEVVAKQEAPPPVAPSPQVVKDRTLLQKASQSLAKIQKTTDNSTKKQDNSIKIPTALKMSEPLVKAKADPGVTLYSDEISSRLKLLLKLPEFGSVTVKLTLKRNGEVKQVDILKSLSELNAEYVKKALVTIRFPGFGTAFERNDEHTFEIILENEV